MDARLKMIQFRREHDLTRARLAKMTNCTEAQIRLVEEGEDTHPKAAKRIALVCGMDEMETEELMPINYRKHGGCYDPDKFRPPEITSPVVPSFVPMSIKDYM